MHGLWYHAKGFARYPGYMIKHEKPGAMKCLVKE